VGSKVELVSSQSVEMKSIISDPIQETESKSGFWYELRNAEGQIIYRHIQQNPIRYAVEVPSEPERPIAWQSVKDPKGTFVLLIPDIDKADSLVLFSSPLEVQKSQQSVKELVRFDFTHIRKMERRVK